MTKPLRLLLVTDAVGGVWVYSVELARALRAIGIDTSLAVLGPPPNAAQREEAREFKLIDTGLPLDWLETSPRELCRAGDALASIAAREGADVVQTCSAALLAEAEFDRPCIAVQHSCVASWWATVKGTPLPKEFEWRRELVERGLARASAVVAPTRAFAAETARIYGVDVFAVHNGRRPKCARELPQGDFIFTASRLWDQGKNIATLDDAAALLSVPLHAAGPAHGPNGAAVALEHARAVGELGPDRLQGLLAARPIFASAAVYEPFGLSVLEAAHAGCALVLSDIPTLRELWSECAIFVPARDRRAFADVFERLLANRDERERLGRAASQRSQLYTPELMAGRMAEIYRRVLAGRRGATRPQLAGAA